MIPTMEATQAIRQAFYEAQSRRPYSENAEIVKAATPPGGEWECNANGDCYGITWRGMNVATINPAGHLDEISAPQIAMAVLALPTIDAALRAIIVLAETPDNAALIRDLAISVIAFVEKAAPHFVAAQPDEEEDEE